MTLYPNLRLTHVDDNQETYTDALSNVIASQSITMSEISAGLDFSMPVSAQNGDMFMTGGVNGIWSESNGNGATAVTDYEGGRTRLELGISRHAKSGLSTRVSGFYDGLGAEDYEAYGLDLLLELNF